MCYGAYLSYLGKIPGGTFPILVWVPPILVPIGSFFFLSISYVSAIGFNLMNDPHLFQPRYCRI